MVLRSSLRKESTAAMTIIGVTVKGIFRDRVFRGILVAVLAFLLIPAVSTLSMRQVSALALTLALSLFSFIMLLLAIFLGGTLLWKDIDRRYSHTLLSLPISRTCYLLGRFAGIALFLLGCGLFLALVGVAVVKTVAAGYPPDRPIVWSNVALAFGFDVLRCILLVAFALFFSTISTSFFLPVFGTIAIYLVGGASQQVYDYLSSPAGQTLSPGVRHFAKGLYYLLPNFSAFNLKVYAIYGLDIDSTGLLVTSGYFLVYTALVLLAAVGFFSRRELP